MTTQTPNECSHRDCCLSQLKDAEIQCRQCGDNSLNIIRELKSSNAELSAELKKVKDENMKMRDALKMFDLSDYTWLELECERMDDDDTLYSWPVKNYRMVRACLASLKENK